MFYVSRPSKYSFHLSAAINTSFYNLSEKIAYLYSSKSMLKEDSRPVISGENVPLIVDLRPGDVGSAEFISVSFRERTFGFSLDFEDIMDSLSGVAESAILFSLLCSATRCLGDSTGCPNYKFEQVSQTIFYIVQDCAKKSKKKFHCILIFIEPIHHFIIKLTAILNDLINCNLLNIIFNEIFVNN